MRSRAIGPRFIKWSMCLTWVLLQREKQSQKVR